MGEGETSSPESVVSCMADASYSTQRKNLPNVFVSLSRADAWGEGLNPFSWTVCSSRVLLSRKAELPAQRAALKADEHGQAALIEAHS